jgi:hypothetical protein
LRGADHGGSQETGAEAEVGVNGTGPPEARGAQDPIDFLTLFNDPTRCTDLPVEVVPIVLLQMSAGMTRLTALQDALAARLLAQAQVRHDG